jgi:hypothetical protein
MLAVRLGRDRIETQPRRPDAISERCGRMPLTGAIVAARGARSPRSGWLLSLAAWAGDGWAIRLSGSRAPDRQRRSRAADDGNENSP